MVLVAAGLGRSRQGAARALLFGSAAGFGFALQTAVTKTFVTEVGGGVLVLAADWSIYVLVASAVVGFVLQQSALKTGVLAPARAPSNAISLFGGVILGGVVYGEALGHGNHHWPPPSLDSLWPCAGSFDWLALKDLLLRNQREATDCLLPCRPHDGDEAGNG